MCVPDAGSIDEVKKKGKERSVEPTRGPTNQCVAFFSSTHLLLLGVKNIKEENPVGEVSIERYMLVLEETETIENMRWGVRKYGSCQRSLFSALSVEKQKASQGERENNDSSISRV